MAACRLLLLPLEEEAVLRPPELLRLALEEREPEAVRLPPVFFCVAIW